MKHNAYETKMMTVSELLEMDIKVPSYSAGRFHQWGERHERDFVRRMIDGMFPGAFLLGRDDKDQNGKFMLLDGQKRMSALRAYKEDPIGFLTVAVF